MTADLERDLRRALHEGVEHLTPDRLRHGYQPRRSQPADRRSRWAIAGPLVAAACVAALALTIGLVAAGQHGPTKAAGGRRGALASLSGTSWTLVAVRHGDTTVAIPRQLEAGLVFQRRGLLEGSDGINGVDGTYAIRGASTLEIIAGSSTLVGYAGHDPGTVASISGMDAILHAADHSRRNLVAAHRTAGRLTLVANHYTLTLTNPVAVTSPSGH